MSLQRGSQFKGVTVLKRERSVRLEPELILSQNGCYIAKLPSGVSRTVSVTIYEMGVSGLLDFSLNPTLS